MPKPAVRAIAEEMGLTVAAKADSQDICFVPQGKYSDIIAKLRPRPPHPGDIVHIDGRVLGRHDGILRYTIGQRRGIGIASGEPLYVVHLDADRARVIVGPREALETHKIYLRNVNWLGDEPLDDDSRRRAGAVRQGALDRGRRARPCCISATARAWVELGDGESGIAPGQACVLYSDDGDDARVLGGGFIERSERGAEAEAMLSRLAADACAGSSRGIGTERRRLPRLKDCRQGAIKRDDDSRVSALAATDSFARPGIAEAVR